MKKSVSEETSLAHPVYLFKLENREIEKLIESIRELLPLQSCQPFLRTLNLRDTGVSVLPEVEEFLIMLYGFALPAFLLDLLIIPTPTGSSAAAGPGSAGRPAKNRSRI